MNMILGLLAGALISVMVTINGKLTGCVGGYAAAVVIHIVGTAFAAILCLIRRERIFKKRGVPAWAYLGGVIGVFSTLFNNFAFGKISVTSITALGLLGQSVASALIDGFGLMGMPKRGVKKFTWAGMIISLVGVGVMLDGSVASAVIAVLVSIGAGITVVLSRTVNARLSEKSGALVGSFFNHLIGLPCCAALWLAIADFSAPAARPEAWMLTGGMFGVAVVLLFNVVVPRLPAFRLTLLSFLGQVFTGFAIDLITHQDVSGGLFWGGVICAVGFLVSLLMEANVKRKEGA